VEILETNKDKSGIYRWTHKGSGKSYVGSAFDLSNRLKNYYNLSYLER
jgi:excinuclease UvrABC nuclease subunit